MDNPFLAKSNPQQTIAAHTLDLLNELRNLREMYPDIPYIDWSLLEMACFYHDLGKMNTKFQNKILKAIGVGDELLNDHLPQIQEVPHGYLSCALIPVKKIADEKARKILVQSVFYHHKRYVVERDDLSKVVKEDMKQYIDSFIQAMNWEFEKNKIKPFPIQSPALLFRKYATERIADKEYIMVKGLLNKIDHAASAGISVEVKSDSLVQHLNDYFTKVLKSNPNRLQRYMQMHQRDNNIIVASTGIGKTEGALFWLGESKGFFTLPLRVSINAIYNRIRHTAKDSPKGLNYLSVGLLHSETQNVYIKEDVYSQVYYEQTRQWAMPLTVCTLDQILDFVFKESGFEQKLAVLAYSKIIIDEIQMYSPKMLGCLLVALKEICGIGGQFTIMTATFAPFILDQLNSLSVPFKMPEEPFFKEKNGQPIIRHRMQIIDQTINIEAILNNKGADKILVIVNTVTKAQEIYKALKEANASDRGNREVYLFHSRFTRNDRSILEAHILNDGQLKAKSRCIWITTQVVEASVDIDFDVLYTELSDLNGLFQRMGRVFRNRELADNQGANVIVFTGGNDYPSGISDGGYSVIDIDIYMVSRRALTTFMADYRIKTITEQDKMQLIVDTYTTEKLRESKYFKTMKDYVIYLKNVVAFAEEDELVKNLRDIFNQTVIPYEVYLANREKIEDLCERYRQTFQKQGKTENWELLFKERTCIKEQIRGITVDIPRYQCARAKKLNRFVKKLYLGDYLVFPVIDYPYSKELGLQYTNKMGNFKTEEYFL